MPTTALRTVSARACACVREGDATAVAQQRPTTLTTSHCDVATAIASSNMPAGYSDICTATLECQQGRVSDGGGLL